MPFSRLLETSNHLQHALLRSLRHRLAIDHPSIGTASGVLGNMNELMSENIALIARGRVVQYDVIPCRESARAERIRKRDGCRLPVDAYCTEIYAQSALEVLTRGAVESLS